MDNKIYAIFSNKYMPTFSDFYCAYSTIEKAANVLMALPKDIIKDMQLVLYEIKLDIMTEAGPVKRLIKYDSTEFNEAVLRGMRNVKSS